MGMRSRLLAVAALTAIASLVTITSASATTCDGYLAASNTYCKNKFSGFDETACLIDANNTWGTCRAIELSSLPSSVKAARMAILAWPGR